MRKTAIALLVLGLVAWTTSAFASNPVRISIVYGGGGNSGAYYRYDFVELFNSSSSPINIGGWAILYATSANATFGGASNYYVRFPAGATIPACGYYLIQCASGANSAAQPLPVTPDATGTIAMHASSCKIGLVTSGTSGDCSMTFVDLVATGASAWCWEGSSPTPAMSNTNAAVRRNAGVTDTDDNYADFAILACNATLPIHNSASAPNAACGPPTGACCLPTEECAVLHEGDCAAAAGLYLGDGSTCGPESCIVPATGTTWGRIKTIYR